MTGKTHIAIGVTATSLLTINQTMDFKHMIFGITLGVIGALTPDIDIDRSKIGHIFNKIIGSIIAFLLLIFILAVTTDISITNILSDLINLNGLIPTNIIIGISIIVGCSIFSKFTPHRTFSHSLLGLILFSMGVCLLLKGKAIYFIIGYVSHLIADMLNPKGINILYPFNYNVSLGVVSTGSIIEHLIFLGTTVLNVYILCYI